MSKVFFSYTVGMIMNVVVFLALPIVYFDFSGMTGKTKDGRRTDLRHDPVVKTSILFLDLSASL